VATDPTVGAGAPARGGLPPVFPGGPPRGADRARFLGAAPRRGAVRVRGGAGRPDRPGRGTHSLRRGRRRNPAVSGRHARPMSRRSFLAAIGVVATAGVAGLGRAIWPRPRANLASAASPQARVAASRTPPPVASPTPTPSPARQALLIHGAGDTNLDPSVITTFRTHGYDYAWSGMGGLFQRDDLTVVNCECAV